MNSATKILQWFDNANKYLRLNRQRHLYFLPEDQIKTPESWLEDFQSYFANCLSLSGNKVYDGNKEKPYTFYLGHECESLLVNAVNGMNLNALVALCGCVREGGFIVVVCPSIEQWPFEEREEHLRLFGRSIKQSSFFIRRVIEHAIKFDGATLLDKTKLNSNLKTVTEISGEPETIISTQALQEQQVAIDAIKKVALGHAKRPLILTADRGRGKSTALALATLSLIDSHSKKVWFVAPNANDKQIFKSWCISKLNSENQSLCEIKSPDDCIFDLTNKRAAVDLILIDEAAAIPVSLLSVIARKQTRIVFATTISGYEGTGLGFKIRFRSLLFKLMPQTRELSLSHPIRWQHDDEVEHWLRRCLLLSSNEADLETAALFENIEDCQSGKDSQNSLLSQPFSPESRLSDYSVLEKISWKFYGPGDFSLSESELLQSFGLLVDSHYQTTPNDLRSLMDHPDRILLMAKLEESVIAVCVVIIENGVDAETWQEVVKGVRRVKGQLTLQSLGFHLGINSVPVPIWRIQRIAVHSKLRRVRIGSIALKKIMEFAEQRDASAVSSSFAADYQVTEFWLDNGFYPVRLGLSRDKTSGMHSALVIKPLKESSSRIIKSNAISFFSGLSQLQTSTFNHIEKALLVVLWKFALKYHLTDSPILDEKCMSSCKRYLSTSCHFEDNILSLRQLLMFGVAHFKLDEQLQDILVAKILQHQTWASLAIEFELSGKKESEKLFKQYLRNLYQLCTDRSF